MRIIVCFLLVLIASAQPALSQVSDAGKLPEEAQRLKTTYQQSTERAIQPLRERYIADLTRILESTTRAGKLEQALLIKNEIAAVSAASSAGTDSIPDFEQRIIGTSWLWNNKVKLTFQPDRSTTGHKLKWETVKPYTISYEFPSGHRGTIQFDSRLMRGSIEETAPDGNQNKHSLIRSKD